MTKTALIQESPVFLNLNETIHKAESLIDSAANKGAELIVFPETWFPGYPVWLDYSPNAAIWDYQPAKSLFKLLFDNTPEIPGPFLEHFKKIAIDKNIELVLGLNELERGTIYNTMLFISRSGKYKIHRKLVPTYTERMIWGRGDGSTINVLETDYGNLGGLVCWEHWMPLLRATMHEKNETIHVAQWPFVKELHQIASRQYAFEGQCYVLACGGVLSKKEAIEGIKSSDQNNEGIQLLLEMPCDDEDLLLRGGSAVIAPDTSYICNPLYDKKEIIFGDIDTTKIIEGKMTLDTDGHYSRPDIFELNVNTKPQKNVRYDS